MHFYDFYWHKVQNIICSSNRRPLSLKELLPRILSSIKRKPTTAGQLQLGRANQPRFSADTRYHGARGTNATYCHANRCSRARARACACVCVCTRTTCIHTKFCASTSPAFVRQTIMHTLLYYMYANMKIYRVRIESGGDFSHAPDWFCRAAK